ncbi:hypothetical protein GOB87_13630 [Acetobacter estunensis]|uniref:Uncharacterized protein n=1 Tax=Acetobacter estunensis TaxID=104097 RepID=A0A967B8R5_9PROT|nr:hypothetical protein [Acetobacter estunensis]NHO54973.1 hypothetical protein [Acetobacter estunensis]
MKIRSSFRRMAPASSSLFVFLALAGMTPLPIMEEARAQGVITNTETTTATVETIDASNGEVLLRDVDGDLFTIDVPRKAHALPHLQPGDRVRMHVVKTLDAALAAPGSEVPESTVSTARSYVNRHPRGMLVSFRRKRDRVVAVDLPHNRVTVQDPSGTTRDVVVHRQVFLPLLAQLKPNDNVDVTTMEAVSFIVLNREATPSVVVHDGATGSVAPSSPATPAP